MFLFNPFSRQGIWFNLIPFFLHSYLLLFGVEYYFICELVWYKNPFLDDRLSVIIHLGQSKRLR